MVRHQDSIPLAYTPTSNRGTGTGHIYFSDLTHEYIVINAEYTT